MLFDEIVYHNVHGTDTTQYDDFIFKIMKGREGGRLPQAGKL